MIEPYPAIIFALGFIFGAYQCEGFRGALLAIPPGQTEAARAYGLSRRRTFLRIIFPQLVRNALGSVSNIWQVMIKAAALAFLIGARSPFSGEKDLLKVANEGATAFVREDPYSLLIFFTVAGALFLVITAVSQWVFGRIERWANRGFMK